MKLAKNKTLYFIGWWLIMFGLLLLLNFRHDLNADEGEILNGAWRMLNGERIYYDFYEFFTPGSFYLVFGVMKIFGPHYWPVKIFSLLMLLAGSMGVYLITKKLSANKGLSLISSALFILSTAGWPAINYNSFAVVPSVWAAFFFSKYLDSGRQTDLVWTGLISTAAFYILEQRGLALAGCFGAFLIYLWMKEKNRQRLKDAITLGLTFVLSSGSIILIWPFDVLFFNFKIYTTNYLALNSTNPIMFIILMAISILAFFIFYPKNQQVLFGWLSACLLVSILHYPEYFHVMFILFPFIIILSSNLINIYTEVAKGRIYYLLLIAPISLVPGALVIYFSFLSATPKVVDQLRRFAASECAESPYVYAGILMPGIYFEARKLSPTPFSHEQLLSSDLLAGMAKNLETKKPRCAFVYDRHVLKYGYQSDNPLENYIKDNFSLYGNIGEMKIYKYAR